MFAELTAEAVDSTEASEAETEDSKEDWDAAMEDKTDDCEARIDETSVVTGTGMTAVLLLPVDVLSVNKDDVALALSVLLFSVTGTGTTVIVIGPVGAVVLAESEELVVDAGTGSIVMPSEPVRVLEVKLMVVEPLWIGMITIAEPPDPDTVLVEKETAAVVVIAETSVAVVFGPVVVAEAKGRPDESSEAREDEAPESTLENSDASELETAAESVAVATTLESAELSSADKLARALDAPAVIVDGMLEVWLARLDASENTEEPAEDTTLEASATAEETTAESTLELVDDEAEVSLSAEAAALDAAALVVVDTRLDPVGTMTGTTSVPELSETTVELED